MVKLFHTGSPIEKEVGKANDNEFFLKRASSETEVSLEEGQW
jgi:hypothetical protein